MYNDPGVFINPKENDMWKPVIAAVNGMACGGALYMLGEADIIIAAENATFFDPHVTYGMVAGFESMHLLQKLPLGETMRLVLLGAHERMSAARAHQLGLVSEVVPREELLERAMWVARAIASAPTYAIQGTVRAVWLAHELSRRDAMAQVSNFVSLGTQYENIAERAGHVPGRPHRVALALSHLRLRRRASGVGRRATDDPPTLWTPADRQILLLSGEVIRTAGFRTYEAFAVDVPGMSVPQIGCVPDATLNPVFSACMTQAHCLARSCPKIVE